MGNELYLVLVWKLKIHKNKTYLIINTLNKCKNCFRGAECRIKRIIWDIARFQRYESGWVQGVWFAIRKHTNNPSPKPFTVDHLPLIAEELRRVLNAAQKLRDHTRKLEQEVMKTVIRGGGSIDADIPHPYVAFFILFNLYNSIG